MIAGIAFLFFGFVGTLPGGLDRSARKATGYLRGVELGSYFMMAVGALLLVAGIVAIVMDLVS